MVLNQFRIPKSSLLSRFIDISPQGEVSKKGNPKILYTAMMRIRKLIGGTSYVNLLRNVVISLRYSIVRK